MQLWWHSIALLLLSNWSELKFLIITKNQYITELIEEPLTNLSVKRHWIIWKFEKLIVKRYESKATVSHDAQDYNCRWLEFLSFRFPATCTLNIYSSSHKMNSLNQLNSRALGFILIVYLKIYMYEKMRHGFHHLMV